MLDKSIFPLHSEISLFQLNTDKSMEAEDGIRFKVSRV